MSLVSYKFYIDNNDDADDENSAESTLMFLTADSICSMLPITTALHWSPLAYLSVVCRNVAHSLSRSSHRDGVNVNSRSCSATGLVATVAADAASNVSVTEQHTHIRITRSLHRFNAWSEKPLQAGWSNRAYRYTNL